MADWWYAEKEKKVGPIDMAEAKRLFRSEKIGPKTIVWREGMDAWKPLVETELRALQAAMPPPLPPAKTNDEIGESEATRWQRFFARIFDVWWETLLAFVVTGALLGRFFPGFGDWLDKPSSGGMIVLFGNVCMMPLAMILDAFVYHIAGNTPGKALLGLKVATSEGKSLTYQQYCDRNLTIWVKGFALGLPLIFLATMITEYRLLGRGQPASYDKASKFKVLAHGTSLARKFAFGL